YMISFAMFAVPGVLKITGWTVLLNENSGFLSGIVALVTPKSILPDIYSMSGMVLVWITIVMPTTFLFMTAAFRNIDPSLEEAALTAGANQWTVFLRVTLLLAMPAL